MVAKAFIATSEDSIVGVSQKGAQFFAKMQANYTDICKEQEAHDREEFLHYSRRGLDSNVQPPVTYSLRSVDLLNKRFKVFLAPRVMKFMGVESTMEMPSGTTEKDIYELCKEAFMKRYCQFGNPDDWKMALDYLKSKSKFKSYNNRMRADELRVVRPTGNKKSKKIELEKKVSDEVLLQVVSSLKKGNTSPATNLKKDQFFNKVNGVADSIAQGMDVFVNYMKRQSEGDGGKKAADELHLRDLSTPERKEVRHLENQVRVKALKRKLLLMSAEEEKEHEKEKTVKHYTPAKEKQVNAELVPNCASMPDKDHDSSSSDSD